MGWWWGGHEGTSTITTQQQQQQWMHWTTIYYLCHGPTSCKWGVWATINVDHYCGPPLSIGGSISGYDTWEYISTSPGTLVGGWGWLKVTTHTTWWEWKEGVPIVSSIVIRLKECSLHFSFCTHSTAANPAVGWKKCSTYDSAQCNACTGCSLMTEKCSIVLVQNCIHLHCADAQEQLAQSCCWWGGSSDCSWEEGVGGASCRGSTDYD